MNRRRFLALLGGTALVPFAAKAAVPEFETWVAHLVPFANLPRHDDLTFLEGMVQTRVAETWYMADGRVIERGPLYSWGGPSPNPSLWLVSWGPSTKFGVAP